MSKSAAVAGTGFEGRPDIIRQYCEVGRNVQLKREPNNEYDENAIAVILCAPRLFGLLGETKIKIGYIKKGTAKSLAKKMDSGLSVNAKVKYVFAPEDKDYPVVTLKLTY